QTPMFGTLGFSYLGRPDGGNGDPFMGQPLIQDNGFINNSREFMGEVNADGTPSGIHTFSFPKPVFAFGADFGGALTGALLTVTAAGQTVKLSDYMPAPGTGFFGFTSTTDFAAISFGTEKSSGSEVFRLDDVSYASRVQQPLPVVPLPASVWFLLFGAGSLGAARTFLNTKPNNRVNRTS
ncbi:MAG: VPLPA-CTERM sorting domain-containing protein, partial [Roseibium sp.]